MRSRMFGRSRAHWTNKGRDVRRVDSETAKAIAASSDLQILYVQKLQMGEPVEELLLAAFSRLIHSTINRRFRRHGHEWADLWQEARMAALESLLRYETGRGANPATWLLIYVSRYLHRYLCNFGSVVRRPVHWYDAGKHGPRASDRPPCPPSPLRARAMQRWRA